MTELLHFGRKHQPRGYRNRVRGYRQFCCFFVTAGELLAAYVPAPKRPAEVEAVGPGTFIVLPPAADFTLSTPRSAYRGHMVELPAPSCRLAPRVQIHPFDDAVRATIAAIEEELAGPADPAMLRQLYGLLHLRAERLFAADHPETEADLAERIDALLAAHCYGDDDLASVLAPLGYSPRHCLRRYREARGTTIKSAQTAIKLDEARRLLRDTGKRVTDIALELGFPSSQHFATRYRARFGYAPSGERLKGASGNPAAQGNSR